jgi:glycine/serine hydroxymethyltransferase
MESWRRRRWISRGITVNKNGIPFDTEPISKGGGIAWARRPVTTRGMKEEEMMDIADFMHRVLEARENPAELGKDSRRGGPVYAESFRCRFRE